MRAFVLVWAALPALARAMVELYVGNSANGTGAAPAFCDALAVAPARSFACAAGTCAGGSTRTVCDFVDPVWEVDVAAYVGQKVALGLDMTGVPVSTALEQFVVRNVVWDTQPAGYSDDDDDGGGVRWRGRWVRTTPAATTAGACDAAAVRTPVLRLDAHVGTVTGSPLVVRVDQDEPVPYMRPLAAAAQQSVCVQDPADWAPLVVRLWTPGGSGDDDDGGDD